MNLTNHNFELLYNSLLPIEEDEVKYPSSTDERDDILRKHFLKRVCEYVYVEGKKVYNLGFAEQLVKYLVSGDIELKCMPQYLYKDKCDVSTDIRYEYLIHDRCDLCRAPYFANSSITTFFSDIVSLCGKQMYSGLYMNILDFNLMFHIYLLKTQRIKNNSEYWDGVDLKNCDEYANSTQQVFKLFQFQYNAQMANTVKYLLRMCINALTIADNPKQENRVSLGILDKPAIEILGEKYIFNNRFNVLTINDDELRQCNEKILNEFEQRSKQKCMHCNSQPKLRVYLCSSHAPLFRICTEMCQYSKDIEFSKVYEMLKPLNIVEYSDELLEKLISILKVYKRPNQSEQSFRHEITTKVSKAFKERITAVMDRPLYRKTQGYYITNMEYVIYQWGEDIGAVASSLAEIDYKKVAEQYRDDEIIEVLRQQYIAAQSINLLRRSIVQDDLYLKVNVRNVPEEKIIELQKVLNKETFRLRALYTDNFVYNIILDNTKFMELAKARLDEDPRRHKYSPEKYSPKTYEAYKKFNEFDTKLYKITGKRQKLRSIKNVLSNEIRERTKQKKKPRKKRHKNDQE